MRLEHPGLVRQGLARDAEHGLELIPVHGVAHEHQPLAAQPLLEARRVEPKKHLTSESAMACRLPAGRDEQRDTCLLVWSVTWGGCSGAVPIASACTRSGRLFAAQEYASST
jgi:hypothetical protein